jgi:hypothetical protein
LLAVLAACETPTSGNDDVLGVIPDDERTEEDDGPADGIPLVFENQSSYEISVGPDNDAAPDQGWSAFSLPKGGSKTIKVNKIYSDIDIFIKYTHYNDVKSDKIEGENRIVFTDI